MAIAELGVKVTADGAVQTTRQLDALEKSSRRVSAATKDFEARLAAARSRAASFSAPVAAATKQIDGLTSAFDRYGVTAKGNASNLRMLPQQFGQIAQQASVTGNVMQAVAIQAFDIGAAFGGIGVAVGALAGFGLPALNAVLGTASDRMEDLSKTAEDASDAMRVYKDAADLASASTFNLTKEFGTDDPAFRAALKTLAMIEQSNAAARMNELSEAVADIARSQGSFVDLQDFASLVGAPRGMLDYRRFPLVLAMEEAVKQLESANELSDRLAAAVDIRDVLDEATGGWDNMNEAQQELYAGVANLIAQLSPMVSLTDDIEVGQGRITAEVEAQIKTWQMQAALQQSIAMYGEESAEVERIKRMHAMQTADAYIEQNNLSGEVAGQVRDAAIAAFDAEVNAANAASALRDAETAAKGLASAIASAAGFSANLEGGVRVLEAEIDALRTGADAAVAASITAKRLRAEALRDEVVAADASADNILAANAQLAITMATIDETEKLINEKNKLIEANRKSTKSSGSATKQLEKELKALKASLDPIEKYNQEMSRLVKFKGLLTEAQYDEGIRRLNEELLDSIPLVGDLSDAFTDDLFGGFKDGLSSTLDVFKNWLKQLAAEAIRNQIFIPITAGLTGGGAAGALAGQAGGGLLSNALGLGGGGFLGSIGTNVLSGGTFAAGSGVLGGLGASINAGFGAGGSIGSLFSVGANAAVAGGGIAASIGAALPVLGAVAAAVSFFSSKTKHLDNGLRVTADNMGVLVEEFNKVEKSRFWGLSKKIKLTFDEASEETAAPIRKSINDITTSIGVAGEQLGLTADNFSSWSTQIQVSLKGLDEAAKNAEIQRIFDTVAEQFSYAALGSFNEVLGGTLIREGETAAETMDALVSSIVAVNGALGFVNQTMLETSVIGANMARSITDALGGVDGFNAAFNTYFTNFYSQEEQLSMRTQRLADTLADVGVAMPSTNAQFRDLVEAQDLTTEAGRNTYAALLGVSGEFANLTQMSEQLYGSATLAASGISRLIQSLAGAVTDAENALDAALQKATSEYNNVMRIFDAQISAAQRAIEVAYRNALSIMDGQIGEAERARDAIKNIFDILNDGLSARSLLSDDATRASRARLNAELAGGISDPNRLREVLDGLNEPSEQLFGSFVDYARDYAKTSNVIARQKDVAEDQLSEAETQLSALEDQKRAIEELYGPLAGVEQNTADLDQAIADIVENADELAALEAQRQAIQDLYGPILGIDENTNELDAALARLEEAMRDVEAATNKVEDAIGALAAALIQMVSGIRGTQGLAGMGADAFSLFSNDNTNAIFSDMATGVMDSVAAQINQLYNNVLGRNVDVAGLDYYGSRLQSGEASLGRIDYALRTSGEARDGDTPGFGNIGAGGGGQDPVEALYGAMLGTQPDPAGVEFWKSTGLQGEALIDAFRDGAIANGQVPAFAMGGMHSGGLAIVGERGPELVNMGASRIYTNDQTKRMMRGNDNDSLEKEMRETKEYVRELVKINLKQERTLKEIEFQGEAA
jgi:hypothetical protein